MSEQAEAPQIEPKQPSIMKVIFGLGAISLFLLIVVFMTVSAAAERTRQNAIADQIDGLSKAMTPALLERDNVKLLRLVENISKAAGYESMTITDDEGKVLATTNRNSDFTVIKELSQAPLDAKTKKKEGNIVITRAITLGDDNVIGAMEIITK